MKTEIKKDPSNFSNNHLASFTRCFFVHFQTSPFKMVDEGGTYNHKAVMNF